MKKDIDIKNRVVDMYEVDTGRDQDEIVKYMNKQMKVRFHSVYFSPNCKYQFVGKKEDQASNSITVSSYTFKSENNALVID